jgi:hypothetical protein
MTMLASQPVPMLQIAGCSECSDSWTWVAIYRDGEQLHECTGTPPHHVFADIDLERLDQLAWIPRRDGLPQAVVAMSDSTMRPILFRRRLVELNVSGGETGQRQTIHCLGWQKNLGDGCNVESFTFLFDDGSLLTSPDRNAV